MKTETIRFFCYCYDERMDADVVEVTESEFIEQSEKEHSIITYERHTIFENGVNQVCLTVEGDAWPSVDELERVL